jgi:hypothetical protein
VKNVLHRHQNRRLKLHALGEMGRGIKMITAKGAKLEIGFGVLNHERHETHEIEAHRYFYFRVVRVFRG